MVKIAIAGGSGRIASGVIKVLVDAKHEILILTRKDPASTKNIPGVKWVQTDYQNKEQLVRILSGVNTVLSFVSSGIGEDDDPTQKLLIDASIEAGVKRFAPSEWSSQSIEALPWYKAKVEVRKYLEEKNKEKKVIEYTLFQPGMITELLVPYDAEFQQELFIDFPNRRAILLEGDESQFTLTNMSDVAKVVARAIEYDGEWPVDGGIKGSSNVSETQLLKIGKKARGEPWDVTYLNKEDVKKGDVSKSSWIPQVADPRLSPEEVEGFSKVVLVGILLSGLQKSWVVGDEWNQLLPDIPFSTAEDFLVEAWKGKP